MFVLDFLQQDTDHLLAYNTKQQVLIKDRMLGFTEKFVQACVAFYVIFFVFVVNEGYLEYENARGNLLTSASGSMVAQSNSGTMKTMFFSSEDITYPGLENGNVFLATRVDVVNEKKGVCEDTSMPCNTADDCSKDQGATCSENKFCVEKSWCPEPGELPEVYKMPTDKMRIWAKSSISFVQLHKGKTLFFSNIVDKPTQYPQPGFNTFTLRDILLLCNPPVRFEEVSELGAAIEVLFYWDCKVDNPFGCHPTVFARRIDSLLDTDNIGYAYKTAQEIGDGLRRTEHRKGIRLFFKSVGRGAKVSLSAMILKASTGASLLALAPIITDFIMLRALKLSRKYLARKYVYSQDFSDIWDELDALAVAGKLLGDKQEEEGKQAVEDAEMDQEDETWRIAMEERDVI